MHSFMKNKYKDMSLNEIIALAQKSDYDAAEELIKREQKNVYMSFSYLGAPKESVSDLTQEALYRMVKHIKDLKNPKQFKAWTGRIITHLFYDELRKKQRMPESVSIENYRTNDENETCCALDVCDTHLKPEEKTIGREITEVIKELICALPEKFKSVIILRELQGLSYEEIAKITQTTEGTVKSRIARARSRLQESLRPYINS